MARKLLKILLKIFLWIFAGILTLELCVVLFCMILHASADFAEPEFVPSEGEATIVSDSLRRWNNSAVRLNADGLWEMKVSGSAFERGEAIGKLAPDLVRYQEKVFADKLFEIVPNESYRNFLCYFMTIFNRRLGRSVPKEYRQEIKAMSTVCTHDFDEFGNPYERQMQYHSAHDIGHVMQDYMLVGCTSFAVWGDESADSSLIVGRNFDFYMGDDFARNKLVLFEKPDSGYPFVSITWPGMLGVLSGMNSEGLTVTINASKLETPRMSATPISFLTKRILQYSSTIEEAWRIAGEYRTFVSESILVSSAKDGRAAIIEKTPSEMAIYDQAKSDHSVHRIVCTNHYQSSKFWDNPVNQDNIRTSDSMVRFRRVEHLLDSLGVIDPQKAALVLRDMRGEDGQQIGYCNDLAINQLLAMHSVIFKPLERKIWVSTSPWQLGSFVCYDLNKALSSDFSTVVSVPSEKIAKDPFVDSEDFRNVLEFKRMQPVIKNAANSGRRIQKDSLDYFISLDSQYYNAYNTVGDYYKSLDEDELARAYWSKALTLEMKPAERLYIENKISE